jgi:glyoxylase-like metal-dependent hydrolase (beta-lactamase superfamily II)/rhodanese-related sulfurtransferase
MYFQQFFLSCLAHASYFIGSEGVAAVVDPQRDVEPYLKEAREHGFRIAYVIETHLHADFVSGHRELAALTGAQIYLGARSRASFPHVDVRDGDEIQLGGCRLEFLETPGHTLESISIVVYDEQAKPHAVLTGDTLFIGDVGRPDLGGEPKELAAMLYDSLHQKLLKLPDEVEVFPAHGAGSLCGRAMSQDRSSTIGRERRTNYALQAKDKASFVELLTAELPDRPKYFATDVEINRAGAPLLSDLRELQALTPQEVLVAQERGAIVLDTRDDEAFSRGHIPGSVNISLDGQFASWAGTILGLESEIVLLAGDVQQVAESRMRLARVGIEKISGYVDGGFEKWQAAAMPVATTRQLDPAAFAAAIAAGNVQVVDVRRDAEWSTGHIEGARHMPLSSLLARLGDIDRGRPLAVHCKSGYRSAIACSLLQRAGFDDMVDLKGGFDAWCEAGLDRTPAAV